MESLQVAHAWKKETTYSALSLPIEPILQPAHKVRKSLIRKSRRVGVALREDSMAAKETGSKIDSRSALDDRSRVSHALLDLVAYHSVVTFVLPGARSEFPFLAMQAGAFHACSCANC